MPVRPIVRFWSTLVAFAWILWMSDMVYGRPTGLACGPPLGMMPGRPADLVSPAVHTEEDQHDERENDHYERSSAGEVMTRPMREDRDTSQH